MGPACDSLDHRARACYLLCGLMYDELCQAIGMRSLSVPPFTFLNVHYTQSIKGSIILKQKLMYFVY